MVLPQKDMQKLNAQTKICPNHRNTFAVQALGMLPQLTGVNFHWDAQELRISSIAIEAGGLHDMPAVDVAMMVVLLVCISWNVGDLL